MFRAWLHTYQNKFNPTTHTEETARLWAGILVANQITNQQFKTGFFKSLEAKHTSNGYPVSSVHDFFDLCIDCDQYLLVDEAFKNAVECSYPSNNNPKWADGICFETVRRVGGYNISSGTDRIKKIFALRYNEVIAEAKSGKVFEIPKPVAEIGRKAADPEWVDNLLKANGWYKEKEA